MRKLRTDYLFDASAKTITFTDSLDVKGLLLITNVTDNILIYNFADPLKGGTVVGKILTLTYNTTSMSDSDSLQIFYEDGETGLTDTELRARDVTIASEVLQDLLVEMRAIAMLLNEGLNTKENLETLRQDITSELN